MQDEYLIKLEAPVERHELLQVARRLALEYNLDVVRVENMFKEGGASLTLVLPEQQARHVAKEFRRAGFRLRLVRQPHRFGLRALFFPYGRFAFERVAILGMVIVLLGTGFLLWPHLLAAGDAVSADAATRPSVVITTEHREEALEPVAAPEVPVSVFDAVIRRDVQLLRDLLAAGHDVNQRDGYGQTPLMYAVDHRYEEGVRALLSAGALVDARSEAGWTALMYVSRDSEAVGLVQVLLEAGADFTLRNGNGQSARDLAVMYGNTQAVQLLDATASARQPNAAQPRVSEALRATTARASGPITHHVSASRSSVAASSPSTRYEESRRVLLNCLRNWEACGRD